MNDDCLFCKIAKGEIPSNTIYEDEQVMAFLDVNPESQGHTLIIPKRHYLDLFTIPDDLLLHIMDVAKKMEKLLHKKLNTDGITLIQRNGDAQDIKHFHLHLVPYYNKKPRELKLENVYELIKM